MSAVRKRSNACVLLTGDVRIPLGLRDLETFRWWARSDSFPERGRIDFIGGDVEVDMTPEDVGTHGTPKGELYGDMVQEVIRRDLGKIWVDGTRLSNVKADLSVEPDILLLLWETLESGRARLVPKAGRKPGRYVEIEGTADLVVEIVSDSSEAKDTQRLRDRYHRAGVREYWIVDARGEEVSLTALHRAPRGYVAARPGRGGFLASSVLWDDVRLTSTPARMGLMRYSLESRASRGKAR